MSATAIALGFMVAPAEAGGNKMLADQKAALTQLGVHNLNGIVVDSVMTREQAMGDEFVPPEMRVYHDAIKPDLRVIPVVYWGLGSNGQPDNRVHVGQIVMHRLVAANTIKLFAKAFQLRFPIHQVIPHSKFGYNDVDAMAANNTSGYRADEPGEHPRGFAMDWNPVPNPMDLSAYNGTPAQPAGAVYDPSKPGTILMDSELRRYATSLTWEWGGNWGNPNADPPIDFYKPGYYDYQHWQPNTPTLPGLIAQLPPCLQEWDCN